MSIHLIIFFYESVAWYYFDVSLSGCACLRGMSHLAKIIVLRSAETELRFEIRCLMLMSILLEVIWYIYIYIYTLFYSSSINMIKTTFGCRRCLCISPSTLAIKVTCKSHSPAAYLATVLSSLG